MKLESNFKWGSRPLPAAEGRRFGLLHAACMRADAVKAGVLIAAAAIIARRGV